MRNGRLPCCCDKNLVKRGHWSPAEDMKLKTFIKKYGHQNWRALPKQAGLMRCGKSCRLRWLNYLRPDLKRGQFSPEEEEKMMKLHEALGNKWSKIASNFSGRTDNEIKNHWNSHLKKKLACKKTLESTAGENKFESPLSSSEQQKTVGENKFESPLSSSEQQIRSPVFKQFEAYNVEIPSKEAYQLNSSAETPLEVNCDDFWKTLDSIPIKSNEVQLGHDQDIHNENFTPENVHYFDTLKCLYGVQNDFEPDATNEANKVQFLQKNNATKAGIDPHPFGDADMTRVESSSDIDLGYDLWYSSWPQFPSI